MIEVRDVTKSFAGRAQTTALDHVSLKIDKGEMVAIIGPSGSGKSTLLHLMGGLDKPTSGEILVDGQSVGSMTDDQLTHMRRDKIGFIFQFFHLLPSLSCLENVSLPLHLGGIPKAKIEARARELLQRVNLGHRINHRPDELSGGERQRVAIARALVYNPPILLGDEPTGNLDSKNGADILSLMKDLHKRLGMTAIIVTHDMGVARNCPRIVTMKDSHVISDERTQEAVGA
jgi:putative ABC transport system ATP-binding protein